MYKEKYIQESVCIKFVVSNFNAGRSGILTYD